MHPIITTAPIHMANRVTSEKSHSPAAMIVVSIVIVSISCGVAYSLQLDSTIQAARTQANAKENFWSDKLLLLVEQGIGRERGYGPITQLGRLARSAGMA